MSDLSYTYLFKIVIVGDSGVGKSTLLNRYVDAGFTDQHIPTIGVDFKIKTIDFQGHTIKLQIWDTAGQERFRSITTAYYRGMTGGIIVFDLSDIDTFKNVRTWYRDIERVAPANTPVLIVGSKCDLPPAVSREDIIDLSQSMGCEYIECSPLTGYNVETLFETIVKKILLTEDLNNTVQKERVPLGYSLPKTRGCC